MTWPSELVIIRHGQSAFNAMKDEKKGDSLYKEFLTAFEKNWSTQKTKKLAARIQERFLLGVSDHETPLTDEGVAQSTEMARNLSRRIEIPHVVFASPALRTQKTFDTMKVGWPALTEVPVYTEERIREKAHGVLILYNDRRVFQALHPEQKALWGLEGPYYYAYPNGENIPEVRERIRSWFGTLTREFAGKRVMVISHHLALLSLRANLERFGSEEFIQIDEEEEPIDCGVTRYVGNPIFGVAEELVLDFYNAKLY